MEKIAQGCLKPKYAFYALRPCGKCKVCRGRRQWKWAKRAQQEASVSERTYFVTLTFRNRGKKRSFTDAQEYDEIKKWLKRVRTNTGDKLRYFCSVERGSKGQRLHYHLLVHSGGAANTKSLRAAWKQGISHARIAKEGDAAYVAKYAAKDVGRVRASVGYGSRALREKLDGQELIKAVLDAFPGSKVVGVRLGDGSRLPYDLVRAATKHYDSQVPAKSDRAVGPNSYRQAKEGLAGPSKRGGA